MPTVVKGWRLVSGLAGTITISGELYLVKLYVVASSITKAQQQLAQKWAPHMSRPEYTHSADGSNRLQDDWSVRDALSILRPLGDLAKKASSGQRLYLLVEW